MNMNTNGNVVELYNKRKAEVSASSRSSVRDVLITWGADRDPHRDHRGAGEAYTAHRAEHRHCQGLSSCSKVRIRMLISINRKTGSRSCRSSSTALARSSRVPSTVRQVLVSSACLG